MSILPLWGRCRPQGGGGGSCRALIAALTLLLAAPAAAVMPDEMLPDPAQEQRARTISKDLRCVVCQNQSIDDSDAPLARDLRLLVREQIAKGKSDAEVRDYVVARYGNFVLLKPPVEGDTLLLWAGPFAVLILGGLGVALWQRRKPATATDAPLSDAERAELDRLS
ncbi:cytochrome C biogenesis protein CcmH [Sphingomonas sp. IBVSS1]|nr:cytochrome C biogenesis protein CcmH [Sphingomonas sp. IBVSS1]